MKTLIIINTILIFFIIIYLIKKPYFDKIIIRIKKTPVRRKKYGIKIIKHKYREGNAFYGGKTIFEFNWKNPDKIK